MNGGGETPVPIPNTEAKPSIADGTAPGREWESRTAPGNMKRLWGNPGALPRFCPPPSPPVGGRGSETGHSEERSNNLALHIRPTCNYTDCMSKMIQLRHVPDDLHRNLKARAALAGLSLSDYLLNEVRQIAERPTMDEILDRLAKLPPVNPDITPAEAVRAERDRM